jgi:hypothetical protein
VASLADTKTAENLAQQLITADFTRDFPEQFLGQAQLLGE